MLVSQKHHFMDADTRDAWLEREYPNRIASTIPGVYKTYDVSIHIVSQTTIVIYQNRDL